MVNITEEQIENLRSYYILYMYIVGELGGLFKNPILHKYIVVYRRRIDRRRLTSAWNFIMTLDRSGYAIGIGKVGYPLPYQGWLSGELVRGIEGLSYIRT